MSDLIDPNGGPDEPDPDFEPDLDDPSADPPASDDDWADDDDDESVVDISDLTEPAETGSAVCPDGLTRTYRMIDNVATIELRGSQIPGQLTVAEGVKRFRPSAFHHAAHRMFYA
jgi:hypothetical protein